LEVVPEFQERLLLDLTGPLVSYLEALTNHAMGHLLKEPGPEDLLLPGGQCRQGLL
jgi:hypothetical protein